MGTHLLYLRKVFPFFVTISLFSAFCLFIIVSFCTICSHKCIILDRFEKNETQTEIILTWLMQLYPRGMENDKFNISIEIPKDFYPPTFYYYLELKRILGTFDERYSPDRDPLLCYKRKDSDGNVSWVFLEQKLDALQNIIEIFLLSILLLSVVCIFIYYANGGMTHNARVFRGMSII